MPMAMRLSMGSGATTAKNRPEREPDRPKEAGTGQGVVPTPLGRERFFGQWPRVVPRGPGGATRAGSIPSWSRPSCSLYLSVRGWFLCSSHDLLSTSTQHHNWLSNLSSAMAMFQMVENQVAHMRSLATQSDVDALESLDLLAQTQALCDEARRAQLALELAQARTADELSAAIQDGKRVPAAACRAEKEERARLRRDAAAKTRQRKEAEDVARRAEEVKAVKRAKQRSCMRELRAKQRQELG